jgi:hypothetical protein
MSGRNGHNRPRIRRHGRKLEPHLLQVYRPDRLAVLLDINPSTLWRWWARHHILPPPTRFGPFVRGWTYEQVKALLESRALADHTLSADRPHITRRDDDHDRPRVRGRHRHEKQSPRR